MQRIWRDSKLGGSDVFAEEIISKFQNTALLLAVLSPRYIESEWCTRELNEFCGWLDSLDQLKIEHKSRIIKVIKIPVESDDGIPEVMKTVLGHQFYDVSEDNIPIELDPIFGAEMASKFHVKIAKLAWEIAQILKLLEPNVRSAAAAAPIVAEKPKLPTVYLAECSFDQRDLREALDAELKGHGYRVLPEQPLAREEVVYVAQVSKLLEQCQLSIHLVGSAMGAVPDGPSQKSILALQSDLALQFSRKHNLRRIICMPENLLSQQPEQSAFIERLRTNADELIGADLLITSQPETLKSAIHAALEKIEQDEKQPPVANQHNRNLIYLVCDERDLHHTMPLRKHLISRGYEVEVPLFTGEAATVRQANIDLMQAAAAILLYYGEGSEAWKRSVEAELRKLGGSGSAKMPTYTYVAEPSTDHKVELIDLGSSRVIDGLGGFSEQQCVPFLEAMERRAK